MLTGCNEIISEYTPKLHALDAEKTKIDTQLLHECEAYQTELLKCIRESVNANRFFKTNDGYIAINEIKEVTVSGLFTHTPKIVVSGLYLRGVDANDQAEKWWFTGRMYGYYDLMAGFLLSELEPVSKEVFCEKVQTVLEHIKKNLHYNPNYHYRQEGDEFDNFLHDAKKAKIDIEYYPEIKISIA